MRRLKEVFFIALFTLFVCEIALRATDIVPPVSNTTSDLNFQRPLQNDPEIGWKNNPGNFVGGLGQPYTILPTHDRANYNDRHHFTEIAQGSNKIDIFGCSFTNGGWYLKNSETFSSVVQAELKDAIVRNFGVWAYGTIQSRMLAEQQIRFGDSAQIIIYGFVGFHVPRNAAVPDWTIPMSEHNSFSDFFIPTKVQYKDKIQYYHHSVLRLPFHELLYISRAIEYLRSFIHHKDAQALTISEIELFDKTVKDKGKRFMVVTLADFYPQTSEILEALKRASVEVVDCRYPGDISRFAIPEDKHPNAELHRFWGRCIASYLKEHG